MFEISRGNFTYYKKRVTGNINRIRFDSPVKTSDYRNDKVHLFLKDTEKRDKVCILVHGLGMGSKWDEYMRYTPDGMGACSIDLPYQRRRKTDIDLISSFRDGIFSLRFFRQGTLDIIRTVDILKHLGYREISIIGISLGSFFSILSMALDKRIKKGVIMLGGGDQGIITWKSPVMYRVRRQHLEEGKSREDCFNCRSFFNDFQNSVKKGFTPDKIKSDVICFYFDPLSFAPFIEPERILMINAIFDVIIPREATLKLWKDLGKPIIKWLPSGHLSLSLFRKKIISYIRSFLLFK